MTNDINNGVIKKNLLYLNFTDCSEDILINQISNTIDLKEKAFCVTVNLDMLRISYKNKYFRQCINQSKFSIVDGKPLIWLSKLFRYKVRNKISGSDLAMPILKMCKEKGTKVLIFGGKEGVAEEAKRKVNELLGTEVVSDAICPKFGFEKEPDEVEKLVNQINESSASIVFLCLGAPKQEFFFYDNIEKFNNKIFLGLGATVDFLADNIKRAPKWMSKIGLEWFYRLCKEPKRLFKRYFLDFCFLIKIVFVRIFRNKKIKRLRDESL